MQHLVVRCLALTLGLVAPLSSAIAGTSIATFEGHGLLPNTYVNTAGVLPGTPTYDVAGYFHDGGNSFHNTSGRSSYQFDGQTYYYNYWSGFAISNTTDTTTNGIDNQYSAFPGTGAGGSDSYAVSFLSGNDAYINLAPGSKALSMDVTNTTYVALTMAEGDPYGYTTPFSRDANSFFLLTITGYAGLDLTGPVTGSVGIYLANFMNADPDDDYILDYWKHVDLTPLGSAASLVFSLASSDNDPLYGMNTPAYFALDNLTVATPPAVPEPASLSLCLIGVAIAGLGIKHFQRKAGIQNAYTGYAE